MILSLGFFLHGELKKSPEKGEIFSTIPTYFKQAKTQTDSFESLFLLIHYVAKLTVSDRAREREHCNFYHSTEKAKSNMKQREKRKKRNRFL